MRSLRFTPLWGVQVSCRAALWRVRITPLWGGQTPHKPFSSIPFARGRWVHLPIRQSLHSIDDNIELTHKTRQDGILLQNGLTKDSQLIIVAFNQWSRWSVRLIVLSLRRDDECKHYFSHIRPIELL